MADEKVAFPTPPEILSTQTAPQSIAQSIWAKRGEHGDSMANVDECAAPLMSRESRQISELQDA